MKPVSALAALLLLAACAAPAQAPAEPSPALAPENLSGFFDCVRQRGAALISAHRGGPAPGYPENALETLQHTSALAPVALEVDVARTADGVLVLLHDDTLERTTTGQGRLADLRFAQLAEVRLRDPDGRVTEYRIPRLADVLAWAKGRAILQLDIKRSAPLEEVAAAVREAGAENSVLIITYSRADAARLQALAPELHLSASVRTQRDLAALRAAGVDLRRVMGWTGTEAPDEGVFETLRAAGVEPSFGSLGPPGRRLDDRYAAEGGAGWVQLWRAGAAVVASDRPIEAFRAIDAADGPGLPWTVCLTGGSPV